MNPYASAVITNAVICACVFGVAWLLESPWALLGLFFLNDVKTVTSKKNGTKVTKVSM